VKPDNSTEEREVTLGIDDGEDQEVVSGLRGGEQILVFKSDATNVWSAAAIAKRMPGLGMPGRR
jgi:multidrug efflux pump subunit AcrA (membrane-fusion protein)